MVYKNEEHYFNGGKIKKHVLNKYIAWSKVLSAIKNGADSYELIRERLGNGCHDMLGPLKKGEYIIASSRTRIATYTITPKGEQLIKDVKQYEKEKKNEESRMFGRC